MKSRQTQRRRAGSVVVLSSRLMIAMIGILAFAIDIGYIALVRTQLQLSADASAMAAAGVMLDYRKPPSALDPYVVQTLARDAAERYAGLNAVAGLSPDLAADEVVFGRLNLSSGPDAGMTFNNPVAFNACRVRVSRSSALNGEVPYFFIRALGLNSFASSAEATAAFSDNFSGFKLPPDSDATLPILPFAIHQSSWDALMAGYAFDFWRWDELSESVRFGFDGVKELNLYPQNTGSPGNFGTIDIGNHNNSTRDISRQIVHGISTADLEYLGGSYALGEDGTLSINADTGISAAMKDELQSIVGQTRIISIFNNISRSGNRAQYTIVGFAGIRVMHVDMTGAVANRHVLVQPAQVEVVGGIPSDDGEQHTYYLQSPVRLVR